MNDIERELMARRVIKQEASWELHRRLSAIVDIPSAFTDTERLYDVLHILGYTYDPEAGKYFYRFMDAPCPLTGQLYDGAIPPKQYV